jgi:hypothetical protein
MSNDPSHEGLIGTVRPPDLSVPKYRLSDGSRVIDGGCEGCLVHGTESPKASN